ncbi:methylated-DNA--[protein]-cysteine S-methyltransferase, partial [Mycobacterium sp. ACS1612]|uniref:methylated-DNA--[protein]-cysteine S-methyltransferase n=1 Tax=Mycobacterium sp. ACS1612 TaxID=1834117 RepID=UPI003516A094
PPSAAQSPSTHRASTHPSHRRAPHPPTPRTHVRYCHSATTDLTHAPPPASTGYEHPTRGYRKPARRIDPRRPGRRADRPVLPAPLVSARRRRGGPEVDADADDLLAKAKTQLRDYLAGRRRGFTLPTRLHGDETQQRIWHLLTTIPYGETITYGELAAVIGDGITAREVGQTVGHNPLSIVIPCHRVVGKNGRLTGYAGGLKRKQLLLELEEPSAVKEARLF